MYPPSGLFRRCKQNIGDLKQSFSLKLQDGKHQFNKLYHNGPIVSFLYDRSNIVVNKSPHLPGGVLDPAGRISMTTIHPAPKVLVRGELRGILGRCRDKMTPPPTCNKHGSGGGEGLKDPKDHKAIRTKELREKNRKPAYHSYGFLTETEYAFTYQSTPPQ